MAKKSPQKAVLNLRVQGLGFEDGGHRVQDVDSNMRCSSEGLCVLPLPNIFPEASREILATPLRPLAQEETLNSILPNTNTEADTVP